MPAKIPTRNQILNARFILKTPPIAEALEDLLALIKFRDTGGYLVAPQRWGKTRAAKYLCATMKFILGEIPIVFVPLRGNIKRGASSFFSFLLNQARYRYSASKGRTETDLRNLFTRCVVSRGKRTPHKLFVLVVDEAQLLTVEQWIFLFNISNEADSFGVSLVVIAVGQLPLLKHADHLLNEGREEIVERFLHRQLRFRGLLSADDLKFVFDGLDKLDELSQKSPGKYLSRFCPRAIEAGWALATEADRFWNAFEEVFQEHKLKATELPMTYVINAVNRLLLSLATIDSDQMVVTDDLIKQSVSRSGIVFSIASAKKREVASK